MISIKETEDKFNRGWFLTYGSEHRRKFALNFIREMFGLKRKRIKKFVNNK